MLQTFDRVGPFVVVLSQSEAIPARKRRVVVRCITCNRVSEMNERSLLDKRTEEQRNCAKCRVYTTNRTWVKGWKAKMENAAEENARLREELETVKRERDQARMAEERARESLDELDAAIYECLPSDYDDDSPLDCVEHAADRLRDLAQERDEARAEAERLRRMLPVYPSSLTDACTDAYRRGAEAMREACVEETRRVFGVFQGYPPSLEVLHSLRALPIPEEP